MATIKKPTNNVGNYLGQQYSGGRSKRSKNLIYKDNKIINQYGVKFTEAEKRQLASHVNNINAKRKRMIKEEQKLDLYAGGEKTGGKVYKEVIENNKIKKARSSDFLLVPKSKSLNQFASRKEFNNYFDNLKRVNKPNYIRTRTLEYRRNIVVAMEKEGFPQALINKLMRLNSDQFFILSQTEEFLRFGFIYDEKKRNEIIDGIEAGIKRITKK